MAVHHERTFETEICEHLAASGWIYELDNRGYDKARALFPEDVYAWLQETQPEALAKAGKPTLSADDKKKAKEQLLDRLVKTLNAPLDAGGGTLNQAAIRRHRGAGQDQRSVRRGGLQ